jgi:5-methylcytosine-specific restriction enzyme A
MAKPWHRWPTGLRARILERDGYLCRISGPGCTTVATEVDHVVRPDEGGGWYDPRNLRASCSHCNRSRGGAEAQRRIGSTDYVRPSRDW